LAYCWQLFGINARLAAAFEEPVPANELAPEMPQEAVPRHCDDSTGP
jgi:hypothetical protein